MKSLSHTKMGYICVPHGCTFILIMYSKVPHTSKLHVNCQEEDVMMGLESLDNVQYPVRRVVNGGGYFELPKLMEWVQRERNDPITRQSMNWNNYEAVKWTLPGEANRLYNYRSAELTLQLLQLCELDLARDS